MDIKLAQNTLSNLLEVKNYIEKHTEKAPKGIKNKKSYLNLRHYLKLRSLDLISLQENLARLGLSSLGSSQSNVMYTISQEIDILSRLLNKELTQFDDDVVSFDEANEILFKNCEIFGKVQKGDIFKTKIMITLPSEAKNNPKLIKSFVENGANIFRINTAHDDATAWQSMADIIKDINKSRGENPIKIYVDLAGPKIRTGSIKRVPAVIKIGTKKDNEEKVVILDSSDTAITQAESIDIDGKLTPAQIAVDKSFIKKCKEDEYIELIDLNSKKRYLHIKRVDKDICECTIKKRAIIDNTSTLSITYKDKDRKKITIHPKNIKEVPEEINLFEGDEVVLTSEEILGHTNYQKDKKRYKAIISCTNKEALTYVKDGDSVFIDDGKIGLKVLKKDENELICIVINSKESGTIVKEEKGINFPDSKINLKAITTDDCENLKSVINFVDIVGVSFAQSKEDINDLKYLLKELNKSDVSIVAKIETKLAVKNMPEILTSLLSHKSSGIMIARGDLAIEVGFQKLAYIQEELLDLCTAAHIPIIYATQVLENQMKKNLPSRAEITDAAFGQRADCIMLNKGAFATDTIKILKDILRDMHRIFKKNKQLLNVCEEWKN